LNHEKIREKYSPEEPQCISCFSIAHENIGLRIGGCTCNNNVFPLNVMKPNETPSPNEATPAIDVELWFWTGIGAATLQLVSFLDRRLKSRPPLGRNQPPSLFKSAMSYLVLGVWKGVCVPLWHLNPCPIRKRPFPKRANSLFQGISRIILSWNAKFYLNCWPDEE
jgi:hypothetical protein